MLKIFYKFVRFTPRDKIRFIEFCQLQGLSKQTIESYVAIVKLFFKEGYRINPNSLNKFRENQLQKVKPASYNIRVWGINKYFEYKKIKYKIKPIPEPSRNFIETEMTPDDYDHMLTGLKKDGNYQWYTIFRLLGGTGCRISEFRQISLEDVKKGYKDIIGKGFKVRRIWIPDNVRKDVLKVYDKPGLIIDKNVDNRIIRTAMKRIAIKYNINQDKIHPHEFRHFFAKQYYEKTQDIYKLKELLGHSSINTTTRYLKTTSRVLENEISDIVTW